MKIELQSNAIIAETEKAFLIKVPKKDEAFWYPKRFCNFFGKNGYILSIWFGDSFTIKVFKHLTKSKIEVGEFSPDYLI